MRELIENILTTANECGFDTWPGDAAREFREACERARLGLAVDVKSNALRESAALQALNEIADLPVNNNGERIIPPGFLDKARSLMEATPTAPARIRVTVEGGAIQDIDHIPPGVVVEVLDFDCTEDDADAAGPNDIRQNTEGDNYFFSEWSARR